MAKRYWLMKSEPYVYSIDDLERDKTTYWEGVRNYQARNLMRQMSRGDGVLYYHSNDKPPGVVGLARVCKEAYPDHTQFDKRAKYYDAKSSEDNPRWDMVDVEFVEKFDQMLSLDSLRQQGRLEGMPLLKKGQRLSVQPVEPKHWRLILKLAGAETTSL